METPEKDLVPAVVELFATGRYDVVLSAVRSVGFSGNGEFPILSPSTGRTRRADVVAARWSGDTLHTVAVECKATAAAVYDALGQAVEYQSLFDEVYIATPFDVEQAGLIRSTLVDLGLGHIRTAANLAISEVTVAPSPRWPARFLPHKRRTVDGRLGIGLAMRTLASHSNERRYGFFPRVDDGGQGVWYAEEVLGHLQWNCWYIASATGTDEAGAGINVERVEDVRRILLDVDRPRLQQALSALDERYLLGVNYAPTPRPSGSIDKIGLPHQPAHQTSVDTLISALEVWPKQTRPQLLVFRLFDAAELRAISQWPTTLAAIRADLVKVMAALCAEPA